MIYVYFTAGAFGSTVEYSIRRFTKEFETIKADIRDDGSLHSYLKESHPTSDEELKSISPTAKIVTPVYPNHNQETVEVSINGFKKILTSKDKVIFITHQDVNSAERNLLFINEKIPQCLENSMLLDNIQQWNKSYVSHNDMKRWEKREYLSLMFNYSDISNAKNHSEVDWLTITADDILDNFAETVNRIISYLDLTFVDDGLDAFAEQWREKQQYIVDQYYTVENIVNGTITGQDLSWEDLNVAQESLIQHKLRAAGFELQCNDLNTFPTNSKHLRELIYVTQ